MVLFLDHVAIAVRDLDGAKDFFGLLGFELADAVVIQGEQFSRYMGVPDLEADHVIMALPGAEPRQQIHLVCFHHPRPLDDAARSRLDRIGINHCGFAVADLNSALAELEAKGVRRRAEMLEFPHRKLVFPSSPRFATAQVRATSSGAASSLWTWSSTAPSTSAAGTLVTAQWSQPSAIASPVT